YYIIKQDSSYATSLAEALLGAKSKLSFCKTCFTFTDLDECRICADPSRDQHVLCVVEKPSDVFSIEKTGVHKGRYHVLHGVISPLEGVSPDDLKIRELLARLQPGTPITEIILATNPSVEGDATALYLARLIAPLGIKVTQL